MRNGVEEIAEFLRPLITLDKDYYDIVETRTYGRTLRMEVL